jgi:hypothetical protein
VPLNVWEKTPQGVFERRHVVDEVEDWLRRVEALYENVREWLANKDDLRFDQTRTITMSEEMMQKFAVTEREVAVLDVLRGEQVVASFVPRGLWFIGAWGRIDIITKDQTLILVAIREDDGFKWNLVSPENRKQLKFFDQAALSALLANE